MGVQGAMFPLLLLSYLRSRPAKQSCAPLPTGTARTVCVCVCVSHMCAPACDFKTIESLVRTSRVCTRKCSIIMFFRSVGSHVSVFP